MEELISYAAENNHISSSMQRRLLHFKGQVETLAEPSAVIAILNAMETERNYPYVAQRNLTRVLHPK